MGDVKLGFEQIFEILTTLQCIVPPNPWSIEECDLLTKAIELCREARAQTAPAGPLKSLNPLHLISQPTATVHDAPSHKHSWRENFGGGLYCAECGTKAQLKDVKVQTPPPRDNGFERQEAPRMKSSLLGNIILRLTNERWKIHDKIKNLQYLLNAMDSERARLRRWRDNIVLKEAQK